VYYIFNKVNGGCWGKYSYRPKIDEPDLIAVETDTDYDNLLEIIWKEGEITKRPLPSEPPVVEVIEKEDMPTEQVELYNAIAGLYELVEKGERQ
jgi:hypothetical protein